MIKKEVTDEELIDAILGPYSEEVTLDNVKNAIAKIRAKGYEPTHMVVKDNDLSELLGMQVFDFTAYKRGYPTLPLGRLYGLMVFIGEETRIFAKWYRGGNNE